MAVISCTTGDLPGRTPPGLRGFSRGAAHGTVGWPFRSQQSGGCQQLPLFLLARGDKKRALLFHSAPAKGGEREAFCSLPAGGRVPCQPLVPLTQGGEGVLSVRLFPRFGWTLSLRSANALLTVSQRFER